ncbi:MAG: MFS transporter, partial [Erysipelotrichia bacterium]|nr:MFS transporter [Erysipelotrichia bacterium]
MKLNVKRTVLVGFAFLSISAFWQMYNNVIPLMLTNTFKMNETWSGVIMAADNVLALFLLPLFGSLSDRCKSP